MENLKKDLINEVIDQLIDDIGNNDIEVIEGLLHEIYSDSNVQHMIDYLCYDELREKYKILIK